MNPELVCTVEALGYQGEGIGRPGGRVTFIPYALPGEEVSIKITGEKQNLAFAELQSVLKVSPSRRTPKCPVFGVCGGCRLQHLAYDGQLRHKREMVENSLRKIAGIRAPVMPAFAMDEPWAYRNKTSWRIALMEGRYIAGFFKSGSHQIVQTDTCPIAHPLSSEAIRALLTWLNSRANHTGNGALKAGDGKAVTRVNTEGRMMLSLENLDIRPSAYPELSSFLCSALPALDSICVAGGRGLQGSAGAPEARVIFGSPSISMEMEGLRFSLSPSSFFQVNHEIAREMYSHTLGLALDHQGGNCIDIYSGIGTISLLAAKRSKQVFGLELSGAAVADAQKSAEQNGIRNAEFIAGPAEKTLPELLASGVKADAVILDPPRAGAHARVLSAIIKAAPRRVAYISCNPASQARDTAVLLKAGYSLEVSQPFDMFPQTAEIENVNIFHKESV